MISLRDSPIYRQKSKDASGHEHSAETGQFTSGSGGGAAKPSKPENKLPEKNPVKESAQAARETHRVASAAKEEFEKAKEAYRQALQAHQEARAKHDEAKNEREAAREKEREKKRQAKKEKDKVITAKVEKLRRQIVPEQRVMALDAIAAHKGTATPEEKKRGATDDFARQSDVVAELEKKGMTNQEATKLLSDLFKAEELALMQTGQGVGKPFMNWFRIEHGANKPANNLPK